jgi:hypothetical protein
MLLPVLTSIISWSEELPAIYNIYCVGRWGSMGISHGIKISIPCIENEVNILILLRTNYFGNSQMHNIFMWFEHRANKTKCLGLRGLSSESLFGFNSTLAYRHHLVELSQPKHNECYQITIQLLKTIWVWRVKLWTTLWHYVCFAYFSVFFILWLNYFFTILRAFEGLPLGQHSICYLSQWLLSKSKVEASYHCSSSL